MQFYFTMSLVHMILNVTLIIVDTKAYFLLFPTRIIRQQFHLFCMMLKKLFAMSHSKKFYSSEFSLSLADKDTSGGGFQDYRLFDRQANILTWSWFTSPKNLLCISHFYTHNTDLSSVPIVHQQSDLVSTPQESQASLVDDRSKLVWNNFSNTCLAHLHHWGNWLYNMGLFTSISLRKLIPTLVWKQVFCCKHSTNY